MTIRAQLMMVIVLDKCLGCHACSVSCKRAWTDRVGSEHVWFNNVETRPGLGYPRGWDDRSQPFGGAPPTVEDYYDPWVYDFNGGVDAPLASVPPASGARSLLTGMPLKPQWGPNWDDDLAGTQWPHPAISDLRRSRSESARPGPPADEIRLRYERLFMLHLPRLCNHCLLPSCAVACRSKAIYKRSSDGIVLVDQEKCRGRRSCVTACPYKKVYTNRVTERAEKCMFCLPGVVENGLAPLCAETCVGRIRSIGVVLYDTGAVTRAAEETPADDLVEAQRRLLLDPDDDSVRARAEADGVPHQWLEAARRSPVYALAKELRVALPLYPEFRTLPMVWYVPPLSPVVESLRDAGASSWERNGPSGPQEAAAASRVFGAAERLRIPLDYLAELFAAGERAPVEEAVDSLIAMREFKRRQQIHGDDAAHASAEVTRAGVDPSRLERLYRFLGIAERKERFVIPTARHEDGIVQKPPPRSSLQGSGEDREET